MNATRTERPQGGTRLRRISGWFEQLEETLADSSRTCVAPAHALGLMERAQLHERRGELGRASALYREASSCERVAAHALHRAGQLERQLGQTHAALATLTAALHRCVGDEARTTSLYVEIGDLHAQQGDYREAGYFYRRAMRLDPGREDVALRLSYSEKLAERTPSAPIDLRRAG